MGIIIMIICIHAGVKNFEENCRKGAARMDDILPGLIIEEVLGINLTEINGFRSSKIHANSLKHE